MSDNTFDGFPKQDKLTTIPELFFSAVLPHIDDLAELKVLLFFMWAVQQREGQFRYLTDNDFATSTLLREALLVARPDTPAEQTLADALARAVQRGVLLCATIHNVDAPRSTTLYFMNTERGRDALQAIETGAFQWGQHGVEILPPRPTIYRLYEQEIGVLTPMIADGLRDLEADYPVLWINEAIRVAVEKQARNLKFIRAVLERWRKEGKTDDKLPARSEPVEHDELGRRKFSGKYADWIEQ